jgi:protein-L-isoaspartate(D-aspartate) O-methyltransferase
LGDITQNLTVITRKGGRFERKSVEPVMFVPFLPGVIR